MPSKLQPKKYFAAVPPRSRSDYSGCGVAGSPLLARRIEIPDTLFEFTRAL